MSKAYIQVSIPQENGKPRKQGFSFGAGAIIAYLKAKNIPVEQLEESLNPKKPEFLESIQYLLYAGAKFNQQKAKQEIDFDEADVADWISEMKQSDLEAIMDTFRQSKFLGNVLGATQTKKS